MLPLKIVVVIKFVRKKNCLKKIADVLYFDISGVSNKIPNNSCISRRAVIGFSRFLMSNTIERRIYKKKHIKENVSVGGFLLLLNIFLYFGHIKLYF